MRVLVGACEPCRIRKRKCDRAIPTCGLCRKRSIRCCYDPHRLTKLERPDDQTTNLVAASQVLVPSKDSQLQSLATDRLYYAWAICSPSVPQSYPVNSRWYMPRLVKHFCEGLGVSRLPVDGASTAYKLQTLWVQHALSDPCLFHATLYAASYYFDMQRGQKLGFITLSHQHEVIKRVNERLPDPSRALDDRTILSITPLALFANLTGDLVASEIHRAGIWKLVELKGGLDKLGMGGLIASLIQMNNIVHSIVFDTEPAAFSSLSTPSSAPIGLETRILQTPATGVVSYSYLGSIHVLFQEVYDFKIALNLQGSNKVVDEWCDNLESTHFVWAIPLPAEDGISCCCSLAILIFRSLVDGHSRPSASPPTLQELVLNLKASLMLTDDEIWLLHIPAAYIWVCLAGAAAAQEPGLRTWFYFKQASAVRMLDSRDDSTVLNDLWSHFSWLRKFRPAPI